MKCAARIYEGGYPRWASSIACHENGLPTAWRWRANDLGRASSGRGTPWISSGTGQRPRDCRYATTTRDFPFSYILRYRTPIKLQRL